MMEDAYFSVVSPESCANILWKSTDKADEAAKALGLTADRLYKLGLIDKVYKKGRLKELKKDIEAEIEVLLSMTSDQLIDGRYRRFRKVGY